MQGTDARAQDLGMREAGARMGGEGGRRRWVGRRDARGHFKKEEREREKGKKKNREKMRDQEGVCIA